MSLQQILGFSPRSLELYRVAFSHPSLQKKDIEGRAVSYERLEFLGDAILGAVISTYLFDELGKADEGVLSQMRSKIVRRQYLNELGREFELVSLMEKPSSKNQLGENIHGNLFEALIGAIYKDRGYKICQKFIHRKIVAPYVDIHQLRNRIISYKNHLINWCQKENKPFDFSVCEACDQNPKKGFSVTLKISGETVAQARSTSKKKAEEKAAKRAYYILKEEV